MSGINDIIKASFLDFRKNMELDLSENCRTLCSVLLKEAIVNRETAPGKHDFTGNLLNSIVVCLYKKGRPQIAYYGSDQSKSAIVQKMTFPKKYNFAHDYEGVESHYKPAIKTDEGWGLDDARRFFSSYRPDGNNFFDIVVAYPVEYAKFIELKRGTAGFMQTLQYAEMTGLTYLQM